MKVYNTIIQLQRELKALSGTLGLVPTMGYLHEGHLSLIRQAQIDNDHVAVSIFVNPTQFAPEEDLASYPRDLERDLDFLREEGVGLVWTPDSDEMYPTGFDTKVKVTKLTSTLEGMYRPGHLDGVTTVVVKLLNIFTPNRLYVGQKDAQQARAIQQLVADLDFSLQVVVCPTVRDPDGVALSSRNIYLTPHQREAATVLYSALNAAALSFQSGQSDASVLRAIMSEIIDAEPLAEEQYVSAVDPDTLAELEQVHTDVLLSIAILVGHTRLIDNMLLTRLRDLVDFPPISDNKRLP